MTCYNAGRVFGASQALVSIGEERRLATSGGRSSVGRVGASQALGRGFESLRPLQFPDRAREYRPPYGDPLRRSRCATSARVGNSGEEFQHAMHIDLEPEAPVELERACVVWARVGWGQAFVLCFSTVLRAICGRGTRDASTTRHRLVTRTVRVDRKATEDRGGGTEVPSLHRSAQARPE